MLINSCWGNSEWDYNEFGPHVWSKRHPSCPGQRQSPINIKTLCTEYKSFEPLTFGAGHAQDLNFTLRNNGHTIE